MGRSSRLAIGAITAAVAAGQVAPSHLAAAVALSLAAVLLLGEVRPGLKASSALPVLLGAGLIVLRLGLTPPWPPAGWPRPSTSCAAGARRCSCLRISPPPRRGDAATTLDDALDRFAAEHRAAFDRHKPAAQMLDAIPRVHRAAGAGPGDGDEGQGQRPAGQPLLPPRAARDGGGRGPGRLPLPGRGRRGRVRVLAAGAGQAEAARARAVAGRSPWSPARPAASAGPSPPAWRPRAPTWC